MSGRRDALWRLMELCTISHWQALQMCRHCSECMVVRQFISVVRQADAHEPCQVAGWAGQEPLPSMSSESDKVCQIIYDNIARITFA